MTQHRWNYHGDFEEIFLISEEMYRGLSGKHLLITGATGLVGTAVVEFMVFLAKVKNIDVRVTALSSSLVNLKERFFGYVKDGVVQLLEHDIRSELFPDRDYDLIIHAAAVANPERYLKEPVDVIDVCVEGTRRILEYARKNSAVVLNLSSVEVYGDITDMDVDVTEEVFGPADPFQVRSSYMESKRLAETLCKAYSSQYGVDCKVARLSKTYGPSNAKNDTRVMAYILDRIVRGEDIVLNSDGSRVFSFCYVTDAVSALMVLLLKGKSGEAYNVADKHSVASLKEIAEISAGYAGVAVRLAPRLSGIISKDTVVNSEKLQALGWTPLTDMKSGLLKQYQAVK